MGEREVRHEGSGEKGSGTLSGKEQSASGNGGSGGRGTHQGGRSQTVWMDKDIEYIVPKR